MIQTDDGHRGSGGTGQLVQCLLLQGTDHKLRTRLHGLLQQRHRPGLMCIVEAQLRAGRVTVPRVQDPLTDGLGCLQKGPGVREQHGDMLWAGMALQSALLQIGHHMLHGRVLRKGLLPVCQRRLPFLRWQIAPQNGQFHPAGVGIPQTGVHAAQLRQLGLLQQCPQAQLQVGPGGQLLQQGQFRRHPCRVLQGSARLVPQLLPLLLLCPGRLPLQGLQHPGRLPQGLLQARLQQLPTRRHPRWQRLQGLLQPPGTLILLRRQQMIALRLRRHPRRQHQVLYRRLCRRGVRSRHPVVLRGVHRLRAPDHQRDEHHGPSPVPQRNHHRPQPGNPDAEVTSTVWYTHPRVDADFGPPLRYHGRHHGFAQQRMNQSLHPGLYVVATPIGNLDDLGRRAQQVLTGADLILAEDTRVARRLLQHFGITPVRLLAFHEHNEQRSLSAVMDALHGGAVVALISDAGTPLIHDPGFPLVRAVHAAGLSVHAVPGPCAVSAALSVAGLPVAPFCFEGFLPPRPAARRTRLQALVHEPRTLVFFEAPHRLAAMLEDACACFGVSRPAALVKELSKAWEQVIQDTLGGLRDWLAADPARGRGEFVMLIAPGPAPAAEQLARRLLQALAAELPHARAVRVAAAVTGLPRNRLYRLGLEETSP